MQQNWYSRDPSVEYLHVLLKMETTIKHAEEERSKALDSARNLYEEMQMLKEEVDAVRSNIGLERLPDSEAENKIVQK